MAVGRLVYAMQDSRRTYSQAYSGNGALDESLVYSWLLLPSPTS